LLSTDEQCSSLFYRKKKKGREKVKKLTAKSKNGISHGCSQNNAKKKKRPEVGK
jgi:hypothetical protein